MYFLISILMLMMATLNNKDLKLEKREGERPKTIYSVPHAQINQESDTVTFNALKAYVFSFPLIEEARSIGSLPSAIGAMIGKNYKGKINTVVGREWTHIHLETGYGSMHVKLRGRDAFEAVQKQWGEYHPINVNATEKNHSAVIMVYAPRNEQDLEQVKKIIQASYNFVLAN